MFVQNFTKPYGAVHEIVLTEKKQRRCRKQYCRRFRPNLILF